MKNTTMTVQRKKATIRTGLAVNIQNMSWQTATELGAQDPYDAYWIFTTGGGIADVQRSDALIDEQEIDPLTSKPVYYLVFGNPEQYFGVYMRIPVQKSIGT